MLVLALLAHAGPSSLPSTLMATALLYLYGHVAKDCLCEEGIWDEKNAAEKQHLFLKQNSKK